MKITGNQIPFPSRRWNGLDISSVIATRSAPLLFSVISQFQVETCERFKVRDTSGDGKADTFCNIFAWDFSRAMDAEIPHWIDSKGNPTADLAPGAKELSANALSVWLAAHGKRYGWNSGTQQQARLYALAGKPAVVTWVNTKGGSGHIAVVRPNQTAGEARIAQAGARNFTDGTLTEGFGKAVPLLWWMHE